MSAIAANKICVTSGAQSRSSEESRAFENCYKHGPDNPADDTAQVQQSCLIPGQ